MEIIIKPTEACNGNCVYCSAQSSPRRLRMFPREALGDLFTVTARWLADNPRQKLRFLWHGGEPTLCGPDYYAAVVREQQRVFGPQVSRVRNAIQSNLTLIDEQWLPLLRDLLGDQPVGTSFDIVDGVRGLADGSDLSRRWIQAFRLLRAAGIRVGVVYVVHRKSLARARDVYWFFRNLDSHISLRCNPLYHEGRACNCADDLSITSEQYGAFLIDLCREWMDDRMHLALMPLQEWYQAWHGTTRLCCDSGGRCHRTHLGINPDGTVYHCGRAADNRSHCLGRLFEDDLQTMLARSPRSDLAGRAERLQQGPCRGCRYWPICHGGCPMMGWLYYGDLMREDYFCTGRRRVFEHFEKLFGLPRLAEPAAQRSAACGQSLPATRS